MRGKMWAHVEIAFGFYFAYWLRRAARNYTIRGEHDQGEAKPWVEFVSFCVECHLEPLLSRASFTLGT